LYCGGVKEEIFSVSIEYLKGFLTEVRRGGYEGFIFRD